MLYVRVMCTEKWDKERTTLKLFDKQTPVTTVYTQTALIYTLAVESLVSCLFL